MILKFIMIFLIKNKLAMKKNVYLIGISLIFLLILSFYIEKKCRKKMLVVSYNVENLFDTIDSPHSLDEEFTPMSRKDWNTPKYYKKISDIAKVINAIDAAHFPDLIGLIEVENANVIEDLLKTESFKNKNYKYVHKETTDPRGIDVALVYNPQIFDYVSSSQIKLFDTTGKAYHTREILLVKGIVGKDTLYVFVNHWKSRYGGVEKTEFKRIIAAKTLRKEIDKILSYNPDAEIICLGDFNDTPANKSLEFVLNASQDSVFKSTEELFNLTAYLAKQNKGTLSYKDNWYMLDNIIVSQNMINQKNKIRALTPAFVYSSKLNAKYNPKANDTIPWKTYGGREYFGGVSDHFPVYAYFCYR